MKVLKFDIITKWDWLIIKIVDLLKHRSFQWPAHMKGLAWNRWSRVVSPQLKIWASEKWSRRLVDLKILTVILLFQVVWNQGKITMLCWTMLGKHLLIYFKRKIWTSKCKIWINELMLGLKHIMIQLPCLLRVSFKSLN